VAVGYSLAVGGHRHPVIFAGGPVIDLGVPPMSYGATAYAINNAGVVVGGQLDSQDYYAHLFAYQDGHFVDLGTLGGHTGAATALNSLGEIVGGASTDWNDQIRHAFLYESGRMLDLNDLVRLEPGVVLGAASGINDRGQIIAFGAGLGAGHTYLLNPIAVPEPAALVLLESVP
jgi:probable HAF family extracellular repeat protein